MTQLPEPNFIDRNPETITNEWIKLYEEKSGKTLQPAQIERLMVDVGAYRETVLRMAIQETAKQNLLSYASEKLGKNVIRTQIIAILNSVYGVFKVDLNMETDIDIKEHQWANLKNWQITIGGYADE